jgi:hypothetical protein
MKILNVLAGVLLVLLLVLGGVLVYLLLAPEEGGSTDASPSTFSVLESGTSGDYSYAIFNYRGTGNLTVLNFDNRPRARIVIINDSQAIQATRLADLVAQVKSLEAYGYNVTVSEEPKVGDGITIIPTGALPSYALFNLQGNASNGTVIYMGAPDLILSSGAKQSNWYKSLTLEQRRRVVLYNMTLDDMLDNSSISLSHDILYGTWMLRNMTTLSLEGNGIKSVSLGLNGSDHMRMIYEFPGLKGTYDTVALTKKGQELIPSPASIYPWERSDLTFQLNTTNGTAYFTVKKDGKVVRREQLRRVTDENVFKQKLTFEEPGEYLVDADDSSGIIASGLLHVKDLNLTLADRRGVTFVFSIMVDDKPLEGGEALVWMGNSTDKRKFYVSNGQLTINTQLVQGANVFNFDIDGSTLRYQIDNTQEPIFEFYLKYGSISMIIVVVVYFAARMTKRPVYALRFGDSVGYVRQEIAVPIERALESYKSVRRDMKLEGVPITPQEFSVGLKRYLTNGADITEGNVEEILKKLEKAGALESHRDYYQIKGEGDVRGNVLRRIIRENLIESGTPFQEIDGKFVTKDYEIGFFGDSFAKKGIIIVDDKSEVKRILSSLTEREQARIRIMQSNATIEFVPIDRLSDML